ncbi:putative nuclease HARBI1 [Dermacentor albipictus]|uniref:putative nuclease HARBI1 n=1 Tax=Dermacentor albipictus TaxID=60249 RepID=UPI0031FE25B5
MVVPFIVQWLELQEERQFREHRDAFQMPEEMFRSRYRLSKDLARWLCEELRPVLVRERVNTRTALTVEVQILCALRFLATGGFQGAIASDEDLTTSQSSVRRSVHAVIEAIVDCIGDAWISFPDDTAALSSASEGFVRRDCRFQGCVGAVDGTFVCIRAPSDRDDANKAAYFCRKGYYALNVMVVCDASLRITALETSYPGSVHDSFVWKASSLYAECRSGSLLHGGEYLLGDSAYPLQPWLVTPVPGNHISRSPAAMFNAAHSSLRSVVERCIGVLKMRFRCLQRHRALYYGPVFTSKIIAACAVLHNLCVRAELPEPDCTSGIDDFDGDVNAYDDSEDVTAATLYRAGRQKRERMLQMF